MKRPRVPRMWQWYLATALLIAAIGAIQPHQLPVAIYKLMLLTLAVAIAHTADRHLFARLTDDVLRERGELLQSARVLARALVFLGCVLGVTLGI